MATTENFAAAVQRHDERVAALGLTIWVGSEPTFTDRQQQTPHWLYSAQGGDKEARARALMRSLSQSMPGGLVLRSVGRLYPDEKTPRWHFGLLRNRQSRPLWQGPPDPLLVPAQQPGPLNLAAWAQALTQAFTRQGWSAECSAASDVASWQVALSAHGAPVGVFKLSLYEQGDDTGGDAAGGPALALPGIDDVALFRTVLACIEASALASALPSLVFTGALPAVDASLEFTTITPDPAVIEVNTAPSGNALEFLQRSQAVYAAAACQQLAPYRLYFNGLVADSGGAGQITLGGPTPAASPFVQHLGLLPRLVCFMNRHPSLSYLFSHDHVGSGGQSVRADERGSDAFDDLQLALALLAQQPDLTAETLGSSLAPFLCDVAGNSHRAEINIEKLWNPLLPGRGCLGLVEFRALRMQHTPERATALACLLRALVAMLVHRPQELPLLDWGRDLHDRFALPFYLEQDLGAVLAQLTQAGLGLGADIERELLHDEFRRFGQWPLAAGVLELRRALEFWPLLGDTASPQQSGASRLVDASTTRLEIRWRPAVAQAGADSAGGADNAGGAGGKGGSVAADSPASPASDWRDWDWYAGDIRLPMRQEQDSQGELKLFGLRYRSFAPAKGLHPTLASQAPLTLTLRHRMLTTQYTVQLHEWHPLGACYDGLPHDLAQAEVRRKERLTIRESQALPGDRLAPPVPASQGLRTHSLDLRYSKPVSGQ